MTGVVVLNYNSEHYTIRCINSMLPQLLPEDIIVIVDNQSTDDSGRKINEQFNNNIQVVYIQSVTNLGYSGGNNLGIKYLLKTGADFICICNPDVIVNNKTIAILIEFLKNNSEVCCVGPVVYDSNGIISQDCARGFLGRKEKIFVTTPFNKLDLFGIKKRFYYNFDYTEIIDVYMISGSFMMFRTNVLQKTNGFDEKTFLFEEESILFFKIHQNRYGRVVFNPEGSVIHEHSGNGENPEYLKHFIKSERYYLRKYLKASIVFIAFMNTIRLFQYWYYSIRYFYRRKGIRLNSE